MGSGALMTKATSAKKGIKHNNKPIIQETDNTVTKPVYTGKLTDFTPFELKYTFQGSKVPQNQIRFVVNRNSIPVSHTAADLTGLPVRGTLVDGGNTIEVDSYIKDVEERDEASVVIVVENPPSLPLSTYDDSSKGSYKFNLTVYPYKK